ncbi:MerR family transcriptional regulator [Auraticoccus sp. F435]|uniref:MerR family transcriptional regulator n=1 Tax=Auraticoccus cholistanensis TaxID=2656650 RepID=A0A6A9UW40_9ACTN|nr:MerR family transcriptional regulator [Auraticoccus cholistanensis]
MQAELPKRGTVTKTPERRSTPTPESQSAQEHLFDGDFSPLPQDEGFRGQAACKAAGITYRQLDYWARTGLVTPEVRAASGSGSQRLYSFRDILILKVIKNLIDAGISLQQIRKAIEHLRARGVEDLTQVTLMSDGATIYECISPDEVVDVLKGGQGMFGIALGGVWRDLEGTLLELPSEAAEEQTRHHAEDELSARRRARAAG